MFRREPGQATKPTGKPIDSQFHNESDVTILSREKGISKQSLTHL